MTSLLRRGVRALQALLPRGEAGAVCLAYHLVDAGTGSAVDLPADRFRHQMEELSRLARVIPLHRLPAALDDADDSRPAVILTFDDAYRNFVTRAWPVLRHLDLPVTLFVPVGFVEGTAPPPLRGAEHLPAASWDELEAVAAEGPLSFGSHGWNHRDTRRLGAAEREVELRRARSRLEERLGTAVESFCYPRALWDRECERWVGRVYRQAVVGGGGRTTRRGYRPLRIQRVSLRRDGPASLLPLLRSRVWLEEKLADRVRRWRS